MGHFYNFGSDVYVDVEVMLPKRGDRFNDAEKREILKRVDEVIAIATLDEDVYFVDRKTFEVWKQEEDNELPETWEDFVQEVLDEEWPFLVMFWR